MRKKIYGICLSLVLVATSINIGIVTSYAAEMENAEAVTEAEPEEALTKSEETTVGGVATISEETTVGGVATISEETTAGGVATISEETTAGDAEELDVTEAEDTLGVEANSVRIDATNFPDENFRKYIKEKFDKNNDDIVDDIENITSIYVDDRQIYSLKGIEFFCVLETLYCRDNQLTSLDVSKNTALESLLCDDNQLTSLDVSKNTTLVQLHCRNNQLTSLDVNAALGYLYCDNNQLTSLDVSKSTALRYLSCDSNQLKSLDVSKNTVLGWLVCKNNYLKSLDINTELEWLECDGNQLTSLEVSKSTALRYLHCENNQLTNLDVSKNSEWLQWLSIDSNITTDISVLNLNMLSLYVPQVKGSIDLSDITGIEKYMSGSGWSADTKKLTYELEIYNDGSGAWYEVSGNIILNLGNMGRFSSYQGYDFYKDAYGNIRCNDSDGNPVINEFKCDGTYTYYFQLDGTAMRNRLTYHPDGKHVIYFDENGHEVFSNFHHVEKSIAGEAVDDLCFFDVYGHMYVDVMTYDQAGEKLYYVNPYGVIEQGRWFEFSDTCVWAGTANKVGKGYSYANADGTLMINTYTYDWLGRFVYMQGNGHIQ